MCLQLQEIKKNEDPRLSFCTPEFKEAQRTFTDAFKVRTGPLYATSAAQLAHLALTQLVHPACSQHCAAHALPLGVQCAAPAERHARLCMPLLVLLLLVVMLLLQRNFGRPVEWQLVKEYPWSVPQLRRVEQKD
jgi:hypothetical protein